MFSGGNDEGTETEGGTKEKVPIGTYNPLRLAVLKLGFTELRWTSPLNYEKRGGQYNCANCGTHLFDAGGKYDSGSGWPSFFRTAEGNVSLYREWDGRIECRCGKCEGHLGHVFPLMGREGWMWRTPTTAYWIAYMYRQQICKWETQTSLALVFRDIA